MSNQTGYRNNNWLNVRYNDANKWLGQVGPDANNYAQFESPLHGLRAADRVLENYGVKHGLDTIQDVVNRFAPPDDNNPTENYINFVSRKTGIAADSKIDLQDPGIRESLIAAMIQFETPDAFKEYSSDLLQQARTLDKQTNSSPDPDAAFKLFTAKQPEPVAPAQDPFIIEATGGTVDPDPFISEPTVEQGEVTDPIEIFKRGVSAGGYNLAANLNYFRAIGNTLIGDEKARDDALLDANFNEQVSANYLAPVENFEEFLEEPTFGGFINQIFSATGQIAPSAGASVVAALTGAGVAAIAGAAAPVTAGAVATTGITAGIFRTAATKQIIQNVAKKKLANEEAKRLGKKNLPYKLSSDEELLLQGAYAQVRKANIQKMAKRGATVGAIGQEFPQGAGTAFGIYAEQGMVDADQAIKSLAIGVPFTAIGVGGEALVAKSLFNIAKKSDGPTHRRFLNDVLIKGALGTGVVEGVTELGQEELSIQQRFAIDEDYTQAQAQLDRAQALFMGFFGGAGLGGTGGTAASVIGKARDSVKQVYEDRVKNQMKSEEAGGVTGQPGQVAPEPAAWILGQVNAVADPEVDKDSLWIEKNSIGETDLIQNELFDIIQQNGLFAQGIQNAQGEIEGYFITSNQNKLKSFVKLVEENPGDTTKLDAFLANNLGYVHNRKPEDSLVVEVRDQNNNVVWYQSTNEGDLDAVVTQANNLFKNNPKYTVDTKGLEEHLKERTGLVSRKMEDEPADLTEAGDVQPGLEGLPPGFEDLAIMQAFEPTVVEEGPGSEATPITPKNKEGWVASAGREQDLKDRALELVPGEYQAEFQRNIAEGNYSDSLLRAYIQQSEQQPGFVFRIDEAGFDGEGNQLFNIKKIRVPMGGLNMELETKRWVDTAARNENFNTRRAGRTASGWTIGKEGQAPRPVDMATITNFGRTQATREGELGTTAEGDLETANIGFNSALAELLNQGYQIFYNGKPLNQLTNQELSQAIVYTRNNRAEQFSVLDLAQQRGEFDTEVSDLSQQIDDLSEQIDQAALAKDFRSVAELSEQRRNLVEQRKELRGVGRQYEASITPSEFDPTTDIGPQQAQTETTRRTPQTNQRVLTAEDFKASKQKVKALREQGNTEATTLEERGYKVGDRIPYDEYKTFTITEGGEFLGDQSSSERFALEFENRDPFSKIPLIPIGKKPQKAKAPVVEISSGLGQRLGDQTFVSEIINIVKNNFKLNRGLKVFTADESIDVGDPEINNLIKNIQAEINDTSSDRARIISFGDTDVILLKIPEGAPQAEQGKAMLALSHELGHSVFRQEILNSLNNRTLYNNLLDAFYKAQTEVNSKQYEGPFGFEEWYADQVGAYLLSEGKKATNGVESFFKRIANKLREAFKALGNVYFKRFTRNPAFTEYVEGVVKSYKEGATDPKRSPISVEERIYVRKMVDEVIPDASNKLLKKGFVQQIKKAAEDLLSSDKKIPMMLRKTFYPADNLLRSFGPIGKQLADIFYSPSQSVTQTGFLLSKIQKINENVEKLARIIGLEDVAYVTPEAEAILLEAEDNTKNNAQLSEPARQVREWLSNFYEEENLTEIGIDKLPNYYPRLIALASLENSTSLQEGLVSLLVQYNQGKTFTKPTYNKTGEVVGTEEITIDEQEAQRIVEELVANPDNAAIDLQADGQTQFHIGLAKHRAEAFKSIPTTAMRQIVDPDGESLLENPAIAIRKYLSNTIKRSEYNKRGGAKKVAELINQLPKNQQTYATEAVNALLGKVNPDMGNLFRFANSWGLVANITTLLAFTVFASLPDLAGPVLRSKEFKSLKGAGQTLTNYFNNREEAARFAKDIGVVATDAINTMYVNAGELDFMTNKSKRVAETFFRYTGLEWYTKFTRIFAAGMGKRFLLEHQLRAEQGDTTSVRYLKELGLTAADVKAWNDNNQSLEGPVGDKIKLSLARFVDESIVRPNAAERPVWASDPRLALVWQLKSFFYAYGKNIIGGLFRESRNRYNEAGLTAASLPLLLAATTLLPLTMLGLDLRERFKVGLAWLLPGVSPDDKNYRRSLDMDWGEYSFEILERSGVFGPFALALPMFMESKRYGDPFWVSPLGPAFERTLDLANGKLDIQDMIPIYSQL